MIECSCKINVRYFPFDTQSCVMEFGSWIYHGLELDIFPKNAQGDMTNLLANSEWNFVSFKTNRVVSYFGCCPEPFPVVKFTLKLQRKSLYYVMNLFIPTIVIALLGVFVFILPVEAGEKVGLEITVMLALAVFLLLIGHYFAFTMVLVGFATIMTVVVLNTYHKENASMPRWVRFVILQKLGRLVRVTGKTGHKEGEIQPLPCFKGNQVQDAPEKSSSRIADTNSTNSETKKQKEDVSTVPDDWRNLSIILDRISCEVLLYLLLSHHHQQHKRLQWRVVIFSIKMKYIKYIINYFFTITPGCHGNSIALK
ncbi:hypothetical protein KUTeg_017564 [Tegillarca granosa]|uniref:Uncharacterized protein n=1 Tax=Tegillarca granosa TaxID=220873 RepID=A0ABQ9EFA1_TEGGR|nr:hypothetical protein KUTeg_017564 [Tegillarca granosa]